MNYETKQRSALVETLEEHRDEILAADTIAQLTAAKYSVSRSAVYRNLAKLEADGTIRRITVPGEARAFYRYTASPVCRRHIHLECSECGRTFHLDVGSTDSLIDSVMRQSNFRVDSGSTVLYGVCGDCRRVGGRRTG